MENVQQYQSTIPTKPVKLPKTKGLRMPHEKTLAQTIILIVVIFCLLFSFLPLFLTVINSFKLDEQVKVDAFSFPILSELGQAAKENFSRAWSVLSPFYWKTILIALIGAILETVISALLAYILVTKNFYFKEFIFMMFISVLLVPSIIGYPILIPLIRDSFGVGDSYFGYLLPMVGGAQVTGMFLFRTFFSQQPKSLYESARLDGANDFVLFTKITLPLALPIVLYYFVGCFSGIYNEYLWASLILDNNQTITNVMYSSVASGEIKYGAAYAMYFIASLPLIFTTIISMKYFKSGEFAAGLKL